MKAIDLLRQLQAVDSSLDTDRPRLAQVEAELADRSAVEAARAARAERAEALHRVEADQRDLELEVDTIRAHLEDVEKKLYGGRVGDAKELANMKRDADQLRARVGTREDRLLELFEAADRATADLSAAEAALKAVEAERRAREAELSAERDTLLGAIATEEARRESLCGQVDAPTLRTYDALRRTKGGLAVAEVRQGTCQGCRVSLPASIEQRARHGDALVLCQSCGRILYATF
jgi:predicted  nucleic acid-binding Zn-ribbon protein